MKSHMWRAGVVAAVFGMASLSQANAAEIKVLTAGAFKQVVVALVPGFVKPTGHKVTVDNGTAADLKERVEGREAVEVAGNTPALVDGLDAKGKIAPGSK